MKSPRSLTLSKLAALSLLMLALTAHAQDSKPSPTPPPQPGGGGPGRVTDEDRDSDGPFRASEVERKAVLTSRPAPGYTEESIDNDVYGVVRLRAVLTSKGKVMNISVVKGLPDGLTEKAIAAAKQISFTPARRYGHTVSQYVLLEYYFGFNDEDADKKVSILEQPQPAYTEEARSNRVAGKVVIDARFHRDGTVSSPTVVEGLPYGLTEKTLEALSRIKFAPAEFKGRKVMVYRRVVYGFSPDAPASPDAKP
jgi:TonB family protein